MDEDEITSCNMALSNDLVLENIFKWLTVRDLKSVRLTSRKWKNISSPIFQRKTIVKLVEKVDPKSETRTMKRFLEAFATTPMSCLPFRNYKIGFSKSGDDTKDKVNTFWGNYSNVLVAFWEKFGPSMESIDLKLVQLKGLDVRDILFNISPNLKNISFIWCQFYETFKREQGTVHEKAVPLEFDENVRVNKNLKSFRFIWGPEFPVSWKEIFIAYPNLMDLSFAENETDTAIVAILQIAISLKRTNPNLINLKKLDFFNGRGTDPNIMHLLSLRFSLKELSIDLGVTKDNHQIAVLLRQQMNLEKLTLYRGPREIPMHGFPFGVTFHNLRYLQINENAVSNLGFLEFMPNLKTFSLHEPLDDYEEDDLWKPLYPTDIITQTDINFTQIPLQIKLTSLTIQYQISISDVKKLVYWFPNVTKTKLHLGNKSFRTVCKKWGKQLEELEVFGEDLTSEGITGIYNLSVSDTEENSDANVPSTEYNPTNITCLTFLKKFVMINELVPIGIDDICVDEGFMKLACLNYLKICTLRMTDIGWTKLFNWTQLETLKPIDEDGLDSDYYKTFTKPVPQ